MRQSSNFWGQELCIVRRVAETVGALNPAEDDCQQFYQQVLNSLSAEELAEWRRQSDEIESLFPIYGSFWPSVEAYEREHPEAA